MQVEHVTRVSFTARRTTQQQGDLAIRPRLFGQIIIDDQCIFTAITEIFTHGAASKRCQELHGSRFRSGGRNDDGVFHRAVLFQFAHHVSNGGLLLADGNVDTLNAGVFLVDNRINCHSGLTDLAVANDQLTLTTADWHHGIDRLVTGLNRLINFTTPDNAGRYLFNRIGKLGFDRAFTVDWVTQSVNHTTQHFGASGDFQDTAGTTYFLAFGQAQVITQHHGADRVLLQVKGHAVDAALKLDHLAEHHVGQTMNAHNTIRYGNHRTFVACFGGGIKFRDARLDNLADFGRVELLHL